MRQTLTYTPHVTLHPVESTVDQSKRGRMGGGNTEDEGGKMQMKEERKGKQAHAKRFNLLPTLCINLVYSLFN